MILPLHTHKSYYTRNFKKSTWDFDTCTLEDLGTYVTPDILITTLENMNAVYVHDIEYMALYNGSEALEVLV